jgi:hypothetical protein
MLCRHNFPTEARRTSYCNKQFNCNMRANLSEPWVHFTACAQSRWRQPQATVTRAILFTRSFNLLEGCPKMRQAVPSAGDLATCACFSIDSYGTTRYRLEKQNIQSCREKIADSSHVNFVKNKCDFHCVRLR